MAEKVFVAVDLGSGSGRVVAGGFGEERFAFEVVHRFPNGFREVRGHLRWDTAAIFEEIKRGLRKVNAPIASIGIDAWGVDYALFDAEGKLIEDPVCYRDRRTEGMMEKVFSLRPASLLYAATGIQLMPINTLFQLFAQKALGELPRNAATLLMMPDIFHYYLSGAMTGEYTNATTTQLISAKRMDWDDEIFSRLDLPRTIMPPLAKPGTTIGTLTASLRKELNLPAVKIVAPPTHDTACAVAGTPLSKGWAYISSGTWSLVGIEIPAPIVNDLSEKHQFTNEGGAYGTIRFLKNIAGLWIFESCRKEWEAKGELLDYDMLQRKMKALPPTRGRIDPNDGRFLNPRSMTGVIGAYLKERGEEVPTDQPTLSRIIFESLADRYAEAIRSIGEIAGLAVKGIHIVGGGSQNDFLNQAAADATGLEVIAGPVEATAIGNLLVQAIADGGFHDIAEGREYIRRMIPVRTYRPKRTRQHHH